MLQNIYLQYIDSRKSFCKNDGKNKQWSSNRIKISPTFFYGEYFENLIGK
jgi:hypothetical protein